MLLRLFAVLSFLIFVFNSWADGGVEKIKNPFYYKIEGPGAPIYLLGTIHSGVSAYELPNSVWFSLLDSDILLSEMGNESKLWNIVQTLSYSFDWTHPWRGLKSRLGPVAWERLKSVYDKKFHPILNRMEPWLACIAMGSSFDKFEQGRMDHELSILGKNKAHWALDDLSEVKEDIKSICDLPDLKRMLEDPAFESTVSSSQPEDDKLTKIYRDGDEEVTLGLIQSQMEKKIFDLLLVKRNQAWMPKIEAAQTRAKKSVFVFVGAGHLFGDEGLLQLFKTRGYTVNRVPCTQGRHKC